MLEKITTTLVYVKRIDEKINTTSFMRNNNLVDDEFINLFPMKDVESLQEIDRKL